MAAFRMRMDRSVAMQALSSENMPLLISGVAKRGVVTRFQPLEQWFRRYEA